MIKDALIIAAGRGSRLEDLTDETPKPLTKLCGLTLIERIMYTANKAGIEKFYISVGYKSETIINYLSSKKYPFNIVFINNDKWNLNNGYSVYCSKNYLKNKKFVLLMSDHVFDIKNLKNLISNESQLFSQEKNEGFVSILSCDFKFQLGIDPDDATKVKTSNGLIVDINKKLDKYNAYDTGMFLCSNIIFDYMDVLDKEKNSNFSLSDACKILVKENRFSYSDIESGFWQDVDTKDDIFWAQKKLLNSCRKESDGIISRNFNRYISTFITKKIINMGITPNQMTLLVMLIGVISPLLIIQLSNGFSFFNYLTFSLGLILYKLSSIMDGCDGEIAKLKFMSSKMGAWLDTICDNLTTLFFLSAISYNLYNLNPSHTNFLISVWSPLSYLLAVLSLTIYLFFNENTGTLVTINTKFSKNIISNFLSKLCKRDFFTFAFVILGFFLMFKTISIINIVFSASIIVTVLFMSIFNIIKRY